MNNTDSPTLPTLPTTADGVPFFSLYGGPNYSPRYFTIDPVTIAPSGTFDRDADAFASEADAIAAWCARRNDWTGRFPCWGDGLDLPGELIVLAHDSTGDVVDGIALIDAVDEDELHHYVD